MPKPDFLFCTLLAALLFAPAHAETSDTPSDKAAKYRPVLVFPIDDDIKILENDPAATPPKAKPAGASLPPLPDACRLPSIFPTDEDIRLMESGGNNDAADRRLKKQLKQCKETLSAAVELKTKIRKPPAAAPVRTVPAAAPVQAAKPPSRNRVLLRELQNERAALARAQAQLLQAQKNGGHTAALQQTVRDRQANIRAIEAEMR